MIYCTDTNYAKVWKVDKKEKYLDLRISTSEKNRDGSGYINSNWFARCIGHAFNTLKDDLKENDRILIKKAKFTNETYQADDGTKKSAFRFVILDAEIEGAKPSGNAAQTEQTASSANEQPKAEEESPW